MPQPVTASCHVCYMPVMLTTKARIDTWRRSRRTYCSPAHRDQWCREQSSVRMADTNRRLAAARMRARNPMRLPAARAKMRTSLRARKHQPSTRGGNGRPIPLPQQALPSALGWAVAVVLRTGGGYKPHHYKLDIANRDLKIAIEVDGASHGAVARRRQDRRKEAYLRGRGWTALRFSNRAVMDDLSACVRTVLSTISK